MKKFFLSFLMKVTANNKGNTLIKPNIAFKLALKNLTLFIKCKDINAIQTIKISTCPLI